MSADLLRRAAAKMRERAEAVPAGSPWGVLGRDFRVIDNSRSGIAMAVADVYPTGGSDHQRAMAEHIASWHPAVALAVADWLDETATGIMHRPQTWDAAVAVARAYLGEES